MGTIGANPSPSRANAIRTTGTSTMAMPTVSARPARTPPARTTVTGPKRAESRVAAEAAEHHSDRERGERERGEARARARILVQVDAAPVRGRALTEERAEADHAEGHDDQRDRPAPCCSGGRGADPAKQPARREQAQNRECGGRADHVRTDAHAPGGKAGGDSGGGEDAHAPEPVERRHDRPARGAFDPHGLFVDGDVHQPRRDPERNECERQSREPACEPGPGEADREQR